MLELHAIKKNDVETQARVKAFKQFIEHIFDLIC